MQNNSDKVTIAGIFAIVAIVILFFIFFSISLNDSGAANQQIRESESAGTQNSDAVGQAIHSCGNPNSNCEM